MANTPNPNAFDKTIHDAILKRLEELAEEEIERATERIRARLKEQMGAVTLALMRRVSMKTLGDELVIRFQIDEGKP